MNSSWHHRSPSGHAKREAARCSWVAGCATGCLDATRRISTLRSTALRQTGSWRCSGKSTRSTPWAKASRCTRSARSTWPSPRTESKSGRGHRGFVVTGDPHLPVAEAARRRDFTINAIAWDPLHDEYLDPYDGRADLERRLLRVVDPATFGDDSLRVLRGLQFAARFELRVDEATKQICRDTALDDLPAERIWGEIEKLLLEAARPSRGFELGARARSGRPAVPRAEGAGRVRAGARVASRGRCLGPHAAGRRPGAHANRRSRAAAAGGDDARRRLSRPREAGHNGVHRRADPLAQPRGGRCRAHACLPGPPECAHHERLRRAASGSRTGGAASEAGHVAQEHQRGRRRRLPASGEEG